MEIDFRARLLLIGLKMIVFFNINEIELPQFITNLQKTKQEKINYASQPMFPNVRFLQHTKPLPFLYVS